MRATLLLPLVALALISTAAAQDEQTPLNCQNCWGSARVKIEACKSLSKGDMEKIGKLSDAQIANIRDNHDLGPIKACLCDLSVNADDILLSCNSKCPPEMAKGLRAEATIVANGVCTVPKPKLESQNTDNNGTSGEEQDAAGSGDKSANSNSTDESNSGDKNNKPSEGGASSVQWSGALLTVVAVMVSAVAF